jgi:hypothetical protein
VSEEDEFIKEELDEAVPEIEEEVSELEESADEGDPEVVERAKKYGHLSKEEWVAAGKDPDKYKTPEEFDKTGKVIEQLYTLKKKVDQRDREIQALIDYQERTKQREYDRARQDLEARLASSKDDMDMEAVSHYTKELVRLQDNEQSSKVHNYQQAQKVAQEAFIDRNQHWFNDRNPDLKARAIEIDNELKEIYPNASLEELAKKIETRMQYEHPDRVLGQSKGRPSPASTTSSVNKTAVVKKYAFRNLSQEHKDTYNVYKRINPKTTEADFINKLKEDGELN